MRGFMKGSVGAKLRMALTPLSFPKPWPRTVGLGCMLLAGIVLGSVGQSMDAKNTYLVHFITQYLTQHQSAGFSAIVGMSFFSAMLLQITVAFFGFSCVGVPPLVCIPLLRGITMGCIGAFLYGNMGMRGLLANLILFWAPQVMQAVFLILFVNTALDTSLHLFRMGFLSQTTEARAKINACLRCFIGTSAGMLVSALLEGVLSSVFAPVLLMK